jgi:UDP-glucuronate decarboxylase
MALNDGRVVSNFIVQAIRGEDLTIYGDGAQTRSFCYVDDLIDGMIRMMDASAELICPINIGNPGEFTVLELAEKILSITGSRSRIRRLPLPQDDPRQRKPDITRAKESLGWSPTVSLDDGLKETIRYFRQAVRGQA